MAAGNDVDTDSNPRSIVARRVFDAPRDLVFAVWTDPKHLAQWWGPDGFTTTTQSFDMRPGGIWRFVMHGPDGRDFQNRITYEEVARPERIVYRHGGGEDVEPVKFKTTVTFEELKSAAGSKSCITMRMDFPSAAERNRVIKKYGLRRSRTGSDPGAACGARSKHVCRTGNDFHAYVRRAACTRFRCLD